MKRLLPILPLLATAAFADSGEPVIQADRAFCALAAQKGVLAAFQAYAAPDCTFLDTDPGHLQGPAAVDARFKGASGIHLDWTPAYGYVSGDLGYTWGAYKALVPAKDGKTVTHTGHYTTIWRRQPDGGWKYVMDTGVPDRPGA